VSAEQRRCWIGPVDDATLDRAVAETTLAQGDVDAVREFRDDLATPSASTGAPSSPARRSSGRRSREVVHRPDGARVVQAKAPRADLLRYRGGLITVLVRRTHDPELATALAVARWTASGRPGGVDLGRHRVGWWTTRSGGRVPRNGARDERGRVVVWCDDPAGVYSAGPGIEFRP
jgi:hypothetical protein